MRRGVKWGAWPEAGNGGDGPWCGRMARKGNASWTALVAGEVKDGIVGP